MPARKARSTAQKVDAAWKELLKLREKYGFPAVQHASEVGESWAAGYAMSVHDVQRVRYLIEAVSRVIAVLPWPKGDA